MSESNSPDSGGFTVLTPQNIRDIEESRYPLMKDAIELLVDIARIEYELDNTPDISEEDECAGEKTLETDRRLLSYRAAGLEVLDDISRKLGHERKIHFLGDLKTLEEGSVFSADSYQLCAAIRNGAIFDSPYEIPSEDTFQEAEKLFGEYKQAIEDMLARIEKEQA